jgi:hypothetical protein
VPPHHHRIHLPGQGSRPGTGAAPAHESASIRSH